MQLNWLKKLKESFDKKLLAISACQINTVKQYTIMHKYEKTDSSMYSAGDCLLAVQ